jgi:hypothetical protein
MPSRSLSHFLMRHAREGVSAKYIAELIIANGPALRKAQEKSAAGCSNCSGARSAAIMTRRLRQMRRTGSLRPGKRAKPLRRVEIGATAFQKYGP